MKELPKHLRDALNTVAQNQGDDIYFAFGHVSPSTARVYMSRLKKLGLAYTYVSSGTTEIWLSDKGKAAIRKA